MPGRCEETISVRQVGSDGADHTHSKAAEHERDDGRDQREQTDAAHTD
jgi:hypothetical protein